MKYAFIVLIALYLIIYGCSPDETKKVKESPEHTEQTTVQPAPNDETGAGAIAQVQKKPAAVVQAPAAVVQTPAPVVQDPAVQQESANIEAPAVIMQQPVVIEQKPAPVAEAEQVVLPCGRTMTQADMAANTPPCMKMHTPTTTDNSTAPGTQQELEAALQNMVETTNDMVLATRELVIAAQALLNANQNNAGETQPGEPSAEGHGAASPQP